MNHYQSFKMVNKLPKIQNDNCKIVLGFFLLH